MASSRPSGAATCALSTAGTLPVFDAVLTRDPSLYAAMRVWRILRRPFPVPYNKTAHECADKDWEVIDLGIAGCVLCGMIHVCRDAPSASRAVIGVRMSISRPSTVFNGLRLVHTKCAVVHDDYSDNNNQSVCSITGYCIREQYFADHSYESTLNVAKELMASHQTSDTDTRDGQVVADRPEIFDTVHRILASNEAERAHKMECDRVSHKLHMALVRIIKVYKQQNTGKAPNLVALATELAAKTRNVRLCPLQFAHTQRAKMVHTCCEALRRLLATLHSACPLVIESTRFDLLVTGLLYLMRTGLSMREVSLLPRIPELSQMLPLESALQSVFGLRSKCITEVENVVKVNLRALDDLSASRICKRNTDEVVIRPAPLSTTTAASSRPSRSRCP